MPKPQNAEQVALRAPEREAIADEMETALRRHVMEAWFPRCIDSTAGGFFSDFDRRWRRGPDTDRMLEFQARQTRSAARLALAYPSSGRWAEYALHGLRCLREVMWDEGHGGWYWMVDRGGAPLKGGTKHAHSTSYAVQACALTYAATGEPEARALATAGFSWFDQHAHDAEQGGYHGWLTREGRTIRTPEEAPEGAGARDPLGHEIGLKDVNVAGDWFEAFTDFVAIIPDGHAQARLSELAKLYLDRMTTARGEVHFAFQADWMPVPKLEQYGYGAQAVQRMLTAAHRLPEGDRLRRRALCIADHLLESSWSSRGGFWYAGSGGISDQLAGVPTTIRRRVWWVQFEGMRMLALLAARTPGPSRFADLLRRQWAFVRDRMTDSVYGGFYTTCPRDLPRTQRPLTRWNNGRALAKANQWKDASHETDALLWAIAALRGFPVGLAAATVAGGNQTQLKASRPER
jgi:mannobiose 2-epimerase